MDEIEHKRELRRLRRLEGVGTNDPRCVICGEDDSAMSWRITISQGGDTMMRQR